MQNYQQVVGQIGGTSGSKLITPEEAVVLIDDLEATAPSVHQHYTDEISLAVRSALTDAELFISYNMPAKALGPLVGVLPLAPNDLRLNQRLAALHTRAGRFAEAAICCRTLQTLYSDAEHPDEATRYGELAERYEERSSAAAPGASAEEPHIFLDAPAAPPTFQRAGERRTGIFCRRSSRGRGEPPKKHSGRPRPKPLPGAREPAWPRAAEPEFAVVDESAAAPQPKLLLRTAEIDLSSEWDDSLTVETDAPAAEPAEVEVASAAATEAPSSPASRRDRRRDSFLSRS